MELPKRGFTGGMRQDIDAHQQPPTTYRVARNGRLVSNPDTDATAGKSGSFLNVPGTTEWLVLPLGQQYLHATDTSLGTVIFTTDGNTSQIGLWLFDTPSSSVQPTGIYSLTHYRVLYDDTFDPHVPNQPYRRRAIDEVEHQRLDWRTDDSFDTDVRLDSPDIERLYWTNRRGVKHVINVQNKPGSLLADGYYPARWSAHSFRDRPDVVFPMISTRGRCAGRLPGGSYQLAVRYKNPDGVVSAISPVSLPVFVTDQPLDDANSSSRMAARRLSHHNRVMGVSGSLTTEGLVWELNGLDVRWPQVQLVVLYYQRDGLPYSITALPPITTPTLIDIGTTLAGNSLTVQVTDLLGEELTTASLVSRNETLSSVQTMAAEKGRMVEAGLVNAPLISMDTAAARFTPILASMGADVTGNPGFINGAAGPDGKPQPDPLTNSFPTTGIITRKLFADQTTRYFINDDYLNDKGQVWDWAYKSYFRQETYEHAVVIFDRQGQFLYATPLPLVTLPSQSDKGPAGEVDYYRLTDTMAGFSSPQPRLLGLSLSGVALPVADLYDANYELNVSGFMIVRRPRKPRLLHQGILLPTCHTDHCQIADKSDNKFFPLPLGNYFNIDPNLPDRYDYGGVQTPCRPPREALNQTNSTPCLFTYISPDVLIEGSLKPLAEGDILRHVGVVSQAASQTLTPFIPLQGGVYRHFYVKSYDTTTTKSRLALLTAAGRPALNSTSRMMFTLIHNGQFVQTYKEFDKADLNLLFETQTHLAIGTVNGFAVPGDALLERNTVLLRASDWKAVDAAPSQGEPYGFRLVNYEQLTTTSAPATKEAIATAQAGGGTYDADPYQSCGHFQPITPLWLTKAVRRLDSQGRLTHYVFNDIELFGGDAKVNFFDFTRLYPYYSGNCAGTDYSVGQIVPIETKYNLMLRYGRSLSANGVRPEAASCSPDFPQLKNGVMDQQPEDWNMNRCLLVDTSVVSYAPLPVDVKAITTQDDGFVWSPPRQSGQALDAWRQHLPGDRSAIDGAYGAIQKLVLAQTGGLYCWATKGICVLPIQPRQFVSGEGGVIQTDSGAVFSGEIPVLRDAGTQHPQSVWVSPNAIGGWDARRGKLIRVSGGTQLLSETEGMDDSVRLLSLPLATTGLSQHHGYACVAAYDAQTSEVLLTFSRPGSPKTTLVYQPRLSAFTGYYDLSATRYGGRGSLLFSTTIDNQTLHRHNNGKRGQFYGQFYPTTLQLVVNAGQEVTFTNLHLNVNAAGWPMITRVETHTGDGEAAHHHILLPPQDERAMYYEHDLSMPLHEWDFADVKQPIRDHYVLVDLTITNDDTNQVVALSGYSATITP